MLVADTTEAAGFRWKVLICWVFSAPKGSIHRCAGS
jgi:hypothetical protein